MGYLVSPYSYANGAAGPIPVSMCRRTFFVDGLLATTPLSPLSCTLDETRPIDDDLPIVSHRHVGNNECMNACTPDDVDASPRH
ncbi:hypothetical protein BDFB_004600, partial [Asbolus verrucosus]